MFIKRILLITILCILCLDISQGAYAMEIYTPMSKKNKGEELQDHNARGAEIASLQDMCLDLVTKACLNAEKYNFDMNCLKCFDGTNLWEELQKRILPDKKSFKENLFEDFEKCALEYSSINLDETFTPFLRGIDPHHKFYVSSSEKCAESPLYITWFDNVQTFLLDLPGKTKVDYLTFFTRGPYNLAVSKKSSLNLYFVAFEHNRTMRMTTVQKKRHKLETVFFKEDKSNTTQSYVVVHFGDKEKKEEGLLEFAVKGEILEKIESSPFKVKDIYWPRKSLENIDLSQEALVKAFSRTQKKDISYSSIFGHCLKKCLDPSGRIVMSFDKNEIFFWRVDKEKVSRIKSQKRGAFINRDCSWSFDGRSVILFTSNCDYREKKVIERVLINGVRHYDEWRAKKDDRNAKIEMWDFLKEIRDAQPGE